MQINCASCGADLEVVGVLASIRETVLFMGRFSRPGLERMERTGAREVGEVRCARCRAVQPAEYAEALVAA